MAEEDSDATSRSSQYKTLSPLASLAKGSGMGLGFGPKVVRSSPSFIKHRRRLQRRYRSPTRSNSDALMDRPSNDLEQTPPGRMESVLSSATFFRRQLTSLRPTQHHDMPDSLEDRHQAGLHEAREDRLEDVSVVTTRRSLSDGVVHHGSKCLTTIQQTRYSLWSLPRDEDEPMVTFTGMVLSAIERPVQADICRKYCQRVSRSYLES